MNTLGACGESFMRWWISTWIIFLKGRNLCRSCCQEEKNGHAKRGGRLSP